MFLLPRKLTHLNSPSVRTGQNRFNLPVPVAPYTGSHQATAFGPSCPQQTPTVLPNFGILPASALAVLNKVLNSGNTTASSEDCKPSKISSVLYNFDVRIGLSLNVIAPATAKKGDKLPVLVWIYGGGFEE